MISSIGMPRRAPVAVRQSKLLGPNGQPVSYFLYPSPRHDLKSYRRRYWLSADMKTNVSSYDRWELLNYSRQLRAQIDVLDAAITQKNNWAFGDGWDPHYCGRNAKWGEEAEEFLRHQFYPTCNLRGPNYHFKKSLTLSGQAWDVDGDDLMLLTESENHFPMLAFYPATRIGGSGSWPSGPGVGGDPNVVRGGQFDGAKIFDGIIFDRNQRMIGVRLNNEDGNYTDISAFNADLAYLPTWHDQGRGIPRVAVGLLNWMRLQDIDTFLQKALQRKASIGVKMKNEGGEAALGNEVIVAEEAPSVAAGDAEAQVVGGQADKDEKPKVYFEEIMGGEGYYLDSTTGEDIEEFKFDSPHPNVENFIGRIQRCSLASVGWFYELIYLESTGRAPTRLLCDLANQSIWEQQAAAEPRARRAVNYAIAKGMKHGFISPNYDGADPYMWEFGLPKQVSVDAGNDEAADRENLKIGTTSKTIIAQKHGRWRKDILRHRREEIIDNAQEALRIEKETGGKVTFDKAMELLEQRQANLTAQPGGRPAPAPQL